MNKDHLNTAVTEAKSAFEQISQNVSKGLAKERNYQESPTDVIAAQTLTKEAFKAVSETKIENGV